LTKKQQSELSAAREKFLEDCAEIERHPSPGNMAERFSQAAIPFLLKDMGLRLENLLNKKPKEKK